MMSSSLNTRSFVYVLLMAVLCLAFSGQGVHASSISDETGTLVNFVSDALVDESLFMKSFAHLDHDEKIDLVVMWTGVFGFWNRALDFWKVNSHTLYSRNRDYYEDAFFVDLFSVFLDLVEVSLVVRELHRENPHTVRFLNEGNAREGMNPGTKDLVAEFAVEDGTIRAIMSGIVRLKQAEASLRDTALFSVSRELIARAETLLKDMSTYIIADPLNTVADVSKELNQIIEKTVSILATGRDFSGREEFISVEEVQNFRHMLQPGDVLIRRNNWQLTNIGIPGFWTHSGLFLGTLEELENYFGELFEETDTTVLGFLDEHTEGALFGLSDKVEPGANCIIEGIAAGVVIRPLENIAVTDYFAVLRPLVPREDKLEAVVRAFQYLGRPYDYAFDFATDMEMICSEVILKAYLPGGGISGLELYPYEHRGKLMFSPNDFARIYAEEKPSGSNQFELVLFIDASEIDRTAFRADEESFMRSWSRSRIDLMRIRRPEH